MGKRVMLPPLRPLKLSLCPNGLLNYTVIPQHLLDSSTVKCAGSTVPAETPTATRTSSLQSQKLSGHVHGEPPWQILLSQQQQRIEQAKKQADIARIAPGP